MKILLIFCCTMMWYLMSCKVTTFQKKNSHEVEMIKDFAYCKCISLLTNTFVGKDSIDRSIVSLKDALIDHFGHFEITIDTVVHSIVKDQIIKIKNSQFPIEPVAEGVYGKTTFYLDCLQFYKSNTLDSIAQKLVVEYNSNTSSRKAR